MKEDLEIQQKIVIKCDLALPPTTEVCIKIRYHVRFATTQNYARAESRKCQTLFRISGLKIPYRPFLSRRPLLRQSQNLLTKSKQFKHKKLLSTVPSKVDLPKAGKDTSSSGS